jgi:hypothetical protein
MSAYTIQNKHNKDSKIQEETDSLTLTAFKPVEQEEEDDDSLPNEDTVLAPPFPKVEKVAYLTQNDLLLSTLLQFFAVDVTGQHNPNLDIMLDIINGQSKISLRLLDWFVTNYSKKYFTTYFIHDTTNFIHDTTNFIHDTTNFIHDTTTDPPIRFKVYNNYKLKLKSYSKTRFDPFCRWQRISIPYKQSLHVQTTIGQLNFFKWAIQNKVIHHITTHFTIIYHDMNLRNNHKITNSHKRHELSISASKTIQTEHVTIVCSFK